MPPGSYIIVVCCLAVSFVTARKSKEEWSTSNTMSREAGEAHDPAHFSDDIYLDSNQGYSANNPSNEERGAYGKGIGHHGSGGGPNDEWVSSGDDWSDDEDWNDEDSDWSSGDNPLVPRSRTKCEELRDNIRSRPLEGAFIPRCTTRGEYKAMQCDDHAGQCWCVDKWGQEVPYTRMTQLQEQNCLHYRNDPEIPHKPIRPKPPGKGVNVVEPIDPYTPGAETPRKDTDIVIDLPKPETTKNVEIVKVPEGEEDDNLGDGELDDPKRDHTRSSIIGTPGLLPGIIGGAVVGLLCAVLLVMFIVYRMRKKDEGSYALDEPKVTSPSRGYTRAPTKEYWA